MYFLCAGKPSRYPGCRGRESRDGQRRMAEGWGCGHRLWNQPHTRYPTIYPNAQQYTWFTPIYPDTPWFITVHSDTPFPLQLLHPDTPDLPWYSVIPRYPWSAFIHPDNISGVLLFADYQLECSSFDLFGVTSERQDNGEREKGGWRCPLCFSLSESRIYHTCSRRGGTNDSGHAYAGKSFPFHESSSFSHLKIQNFQSESEPTNWK